MAVNDSYEFPYTGAGKLDVLSNDEGGPTADDLALIAAVVGGSA